MKVASLRKGRVGGSERAEANGAASSASRDENSRRKKK